MVKTKNKISDEYWMKIALEEARKGAGHTSPNPMVGAVLVRRGVLLAKAHHRRAGLPHAEIGALRKIKHPKGATLYVTLEPCCHTNKRTPPCVEAIIKSGIRKIVIGCRDPNPKVSGRGIRRLRQAGIQTRVGILEEECRELNLFYNHWMKTRRPWVILKMAQSLDGRVALANGLSQWISGPLARSWVHRLRSEVDGILVGVGTIQTDNPRLTARFKKKSHQPIRIVLDPHLKISERARVISKNSPGKSWIIVSPKNVSGAKAKRLGKAGVELIPLALSRSGAFDLENLLKELGRREVLSLLVEGGSRTWSGFLKQKCFEEILLVVAAKFLGSDAIPSVGPLRLKKLSNKSSLQLRSIARLGADVILSYLTKMSPAR